VVDLTLVINHPNAKATSSTTIEYPDGPKKVLMVDTDLKMDRENPAYDAAKVASLHEACRSIAEKFPLLVDHYSIRAWK
jgi:hypothetical protein